MNSFSAPNWCFFDGTISAQDYYRAMRAAGYSAVEMAPPSEFELAQESGLSILNVSYPSLTEGFANTSDMTQTIENYVQVCHQAAANGAPNLIVFSGNRAGLDGRNRCVEGFSKVLEQIQGLPLTLHFEMFCEQNHGGYDAVSSEYGFWLTRELDNPQFKVVYDAYHMLQMGEDAERDIAENLDLIGHVHIAQPPDRSIPTTTEQINWTQILAPWQGLVGIEFTCMRDKIAAARQAIENLSSTPGA